MKLNLRQSCHSLYRDVSRRNQHLIHLYQIPHFLDSKFMHSSCLNQLSGEPQSRSKSRHFADLADRKTSSNWISSPTLLIFRKAESCTAQGKKQLSHCVSLAPGTVTGTYQASRIYRISEWYENIRLLFKKIS